MNNPLDYIDPQGHEPDNLQGVPGFHPITNPEATTLRKIMLDPDFRYFAEKSKTFMSAVKEIPNKLLDVPIIEQINRVLNRPGSAGGYIPSEHTIHVKRLYPINIVRFLHIAHETFHVLQYSLVTQQLVGKAREERIRNFALSMTENQFIRWQLSEEQRTYNVEAKIIRELLETKELRGVSIEQREDLKEIAESNETRWTFGGKSLKEIEEREEFGRGLIEEYKWREYWHSSWIERMIQQHREWKEQRGYPTASLIP